MGWKELPAWMKGGVIGILAWFVYFQDLVIRDSLSETCLPLGEGCASFFIVYAQRTIGWFLIIGFFTLIIYSLIGTVLGALIGWIVGKIKQRKTEASAPSW